MKIITVLCAFFYSIVIFSQDPYLEFKKRDYPSNSIQEKFYNFGKFQIEIIHVNNSTDNSFSCRIWLRVKEGQTVIDKLYFSNCPGVGGCSGIFVSKQKRDDYFILSKLGNYSGQIIIIDTTGKIKAFSGGIYCYSNDNNYLFTSYDSDISGLTIFDFTKNDSIYSSEISNGYLEKLYYFNRKYYFTISQEGTDTPITEMLIFDPDVGKIKRATIDALL